MRKGIIDRFEGDYAIIEVDGKTEDVLKELLPNNSKVGDVLVFSEANIFVDGVETLTRKRRIKKLMNDIWKD